MRHTRLEHLLHVGPFRDVAEPHDLALGDSPMRRDHLRGRAFAGLVSLPRNRLQPRALEGTWPDQRAL